MKRFSLKHILIGAFVITVLPLYACFVLMYQISYNTVERSVVGSMLNESGVLIKELDRQVNQLWKRQYEVLLSRSVNALVFQDVYAYSDFDISMAKLDMQQLINIVDGSNDISEKIELFFPERNTVISTESSISIMEEEQRKQLSRGLQAVKGRQLLLNQGSQMYMLASNSEAAAGNSLPTAIIQSTISSRKILNRILESRTQHKYPSQFVLQNVGSNTVFATTAKADEIDAISTVLARETPKDQTSGYWSSRIGGTEYVITYTNSAELGMVLYEIIPSGIIFSEPNSIKNLSFFSIGLLLLVVLLFYIMSRKWFYRPTQVLVNAFDQIRRNQLGQPISEPPSTREYELIYNSFNEMTANLNNLVQKNLLNKILVQEAQLKQLQFQINPHFLYNSFFILNSMVRMEDYENVENMSNLLGTYLKYITYDKSNTVNLSQEVDHARIYTDIQLFRFSRRLSVEFQKLPEEMCNITVPRILLQPLIENSFLHGMKNRESGGLIRVSFRKEQGSILLTVEDNGTDLDDAKIEEIGRHIHGQALNFESESVALTNIHKRLAVIYGEQSGLYAEKSALGGLKISAVITLPPEKGPSGLCTNY